MSLTFEIIRGILILLVSCAGVGWVMWRWLKGSRDPAWVILRWSITAPILIGLAYVGAVARKQLENGDKAGAMLVIYAAVAGVTLAIVWVPVITDVVGRFFGNFYDGGGLEVEQKPFYSIFRAKRTRGRYFEALTEVRRQLDRFPTDFEGHMLLAELQAENLNDLPGAALTIERACDLPAQEPKNISYALNKLADWHLGLTRDRESAQHVLESIIARLPDTEMAQRASQRIAHLADSERLLAPLDVKPISVKAGVKNLGLLRGTDGRLRAPEVDQTKLAEDYVSHLEKHPLDTEAREKLATIYAKHFHRLDLALDQLEQMIQQPNMTIRQVTHWLNLMTDLQVHENATEADVRQTLQRIIDLSPNTSAAQVAQRRLDRLKLELRSKTSGKGVEMGVYEQNIGLKKRA